MNYGNSGREHYNGLTKERGPDPGDLSETSTGDEQVWAVGWYNAVGAYQLGKSGATDVIRMKLPPSSFQMIPCPSSSYSRMPIQR